MKYQDTCKLKNTNNEKLDEIFKANLENKIIKE
jgi:hypothetical protein